MKLSVVNKSGKAESDLDVSDKVFAADFNEALIHQVVSAYLAGGRSGNRAQKNRSAVRGGGRKPYRQKGTGQARAGTIRSPIWRGGGRIFPAQNADFSQKVNRKMHRSAICSILSELVRQNRLLTVSKLEAKEPKTGVLATQLQKLGAGADVLIITDAVENNMQLSARNMPKVDAVSVSSVNPVSLVGHEKVVMTVAVAKKFEEMLG
ncbi:MAG: 50S ribosomal protein L4 [Gammaproteobacteria bacterium]|nr:MAG: 50S ribosomal protein L4 [Gammaproteobacteria bacterium]